MNNFSEVMPSLAELADKHGTDKGLSKHQYTRLYEMLFQPLRKQPLRLLEMGLQIGGPEFGFEACRDTTALPSVEMWLEYFTQATIVGLDVSDFSWYKNDRFSFHQCDMNERENIADFAEKIDPVDIVIDDASHASLHQQHAFLELFPKLTSGGLYIIEDLHWQPKSYEFEHKGVVKTGELFTEFNRHRKFKRTFGGLHHELNALVPEISGVFVFKNRFYPRAPRDKILVVHKV